MNETSKPETNEAVQAAQRSREQAQKEREQAAADLAQAESELEQHRARIAAAKTAVVTATTKAQQSEMAVRRAEASIVPARVTKPAAEKVARKLSDAFHDFAHPRQNDTRNEAERRDAAWEAIDAARDQLLTTEVDEDAIEIVFSTEGVIHAAERWELHRSADKPADALTGDTLSDGPASCRRVLAMMHELRTVLDGAPLPAASDIGQLIAQDVHPAQIARIVGLVNPNGSPALPELGRLVNSGAARPSLLATRWYGVYDLSEAWQIRQNNVDRRRQLRADHYMASAHGAARADRLSPLYANRGHHPDHEFVNHEFVADLMAEERAKQEAIEQEPVSKERQKREPISAARVREIVKNATARA